MKHYRVIITTAICHAFISQVCVFGAANKCEVSGELKQWHKVTLTFSGPQTGENAQSNPFRNYRLNVTFTKGSKQYVVPGYYAADGNASESSATNAWKI